MAVSVSLGLIPFSQNQMIMQTSPFWVSIVGYFINGEKLMAYEFVAIGISFAGVAGIIFSRSSTTSNQDS
jgi:drug/metabolite transporter (DMT)-like permease